MNFRLFYFLRFFILSIFGYSQDVSDSTIATHHNFKNREDKIGEYVKCSVQLTTVVYNSFSKELIRQEKTNEFILCKQQRR